MTPKFNKTPYMNGGYRCDFEGTLLLRLCIAATILETEWRLDGPPVFINDYNHLSITSTMTRDLYVEYLHVFTYFYILKRCYSAVPAKAFRKLSTPLGLPETPPTCARNVAVKL
jgi:hypothetical protein